MGNKYKMGSRNRKLNTGKGPIIVPQRKARIIALSVVAGLILIAAAVWFVLDMNSYVATVAGSRISTSEYTFFLKQQQQQVEYQEGISDKTDEERAAWWATKTAEGEDPFVLAKNDALDSTKEYKIQLLKAAELGLSVDETIRSYVQTNVVDTYKSYLGEESYLTYLETSYGVDEKQFVAIAEKLTLITNFRDAYIQQNFTAPTYTDEELMAEYEANIDTYRDADVRWIYFSKTKMAEDGTSTDLTAEEIAAKMATAEDLLAQIQDGADMVALVKSNSEDTARETDEGLKTLNKSTYGAYAEFAPILDFTFTAELQDVALVETTSGIYVVRLEALTSFEDKKEDVTSSKLGTAQTEFYTAALDGWMADPAYNLIRRSTVLDRFTLE